MNVENLWYSTEKLDGSYVSAPFDEEMLKSIENELGYKLPASYVNLMKQKNGGALERCMFEADYDFYVEVHAIYGIGREKSDSLCGSNGSKFWIEEWEYPNIGVAIADCPSAGHEMIFLDYRECGPNCENGEPKVVYIDQESDYNIVVLANTFEEFINGLMTEEEAGI